MVIKDIKEIKDCFSRYNDFQECIIEDLLLEDYFTTIKITINNIWNSDGQIRNNLNTEKDILQLRFKGLNSFEIFNDLYESILTQIDEINWGFNEVALAKVELEENNYIRVVFLWESNRAIKITFKELELFTD